VRKWIAIAAAAGVGYLILKGRGSKDSGLIPMSSADASSVIKRGLVPASYLKDGYSFYWTSENGVSEPYSKRVSVQKNGVWEDEKRAVVPVSMKN